MTRLGGDYYPDLEEAELQYRPRRPPAKLEMRMARRERDGG
jgi:hypothetical protein